MSYKQEPDSLDYDRFLDFDQALLSPGSSTAKGKAIQTPDIRTPTSNRAFLAQQQQQQNAQPMFSGPSHQYDQHTQQTGLPTGALANALAANRNTAFHLGGYSNTFGGSNSGVDFDFNAAMPQTFDSMDTDVDFSMPMDGFYSQGSSSGFVDPNVLGGQEDVSPPPQHVRMWPGMHTRQAEMAKQQQQQEIQRQQQSKVAQSQPQSSQGHKRSASKTTNAPKPADPIVEERISRLLNQMRHSSVSSSNEENAAQASQSQAARIKKDEEDMDDDEKLLASEEGKKLSSKERRQLRNKVSARAFRSRRKEYIGQLEGEISMKAQEADDLRAENEALKAENMRLTDLSKMLLSSPAFSNFLNDLSANGVPGLPTALTQQQQMSQVQQQPQQQQVPKDVNTSRSQIQLQQQGSAQIGMAMLPENNMDFFSQSNGNWNTGMDYNFNEPQVFAVTELPEGPAPETLDTGILSGKSSNFVPSFADAKDDTPVIEAMPKPEVELPEVKPEEPVAPVVDDSVEFDESDPAFALFVDSPAPSSQSSEPQYQIFGNIEMSKACARIDLVAEDDQSDDTDVSAATMARFEAICSSLDYLSSRVANLTGDL